MAECRCGREAVIPAYAGVDHEAHLAMDAELSDPRVRGGRPLDSEALVVRRQ